LHLIHYNFVIFRLNAQKKYFLSIVLGTNNVRHAQEIDFHFYKIERQVMPVR